MHSNNLLKIHRRLPKNNNHKNLPSNQNPYPKEKRNISNSEHKSSNTKLNSSINLRFIIIPTGSKNHQPHKIIEERKQNKEKQRSKSISRNHLSIFNEKQSLYTYS